MLKRHAFSFGLQDNPPEGARTISGKAPPRPEKGLVSDRVFGEYLCCQTQIFPGLAGTPARLIGGFRVSGASIAPCIKPGASRPIRLESRCSPVTSTRCPGDRRMIGC